MGSVLSMDRQPADSNVETVELTAARSSRLSVDSPSEIARPAKPEVAPKPVITRQPSVLAPLSQMWTDSRSSLQLPAESPGMTELGSCTAAPYPLLNNTGNGSGINDDVMPVADRGLRAYNSMAAILKMAAESTANLQLAGLG